MKEKIEKAIYSGLGMLSMGKDALEKTFKKISEDLKMTEEEGKKFAEELRTEADKAKENLEGIVEKSVKKVLDTLHLATEKEVSELKQKIADLEKKLKSASKSEK